jgi:hypothetical protein
MLDNAGLLVYSGLVNTKKETNMPHYQVTGKNKRGYAFESEIYNKYKDAFCFAMECFNSGQYSVIVILEEGSGLNAGKFFLRRIVK